MLKTYIIAEIGCNHNGDVQLATKMVDEAYKCGVDAVKFQTFKASNLVSKYAPKAEYQKITTGNTESQLEMTRKLELSQSDFLGLRDYAVKKGLDVFSTPFDMESIDFLERSGQHIWKIPSGEITNLPYLQKISNIKCENKKIILSTGMSTIEEIKRTLEILDTNNNDITILHCNTEYPTQDKDVNIRAIKDLQKNFEKYKIGFSDHSIGYVAALLAVAYGCEIIEKHFTLDHNMPGPDHKASATPEEMTMLCQFVRRAEVLLGSDKKIVTNSERKNKIVARKSIVAKRFIEKNEMLTEENITCKRPGNGISPMHWYEILGTKAIVDFKEDELIKADIVKWEE
jgi:N-acetylneuraminate synthase